MLILCWHKGYASFMILPSIFGLVFWVISLSIFATFFPLLFCFYHILIFVSAHVVSAGIGWRQLASVGVGWHRLVGVGWPQLTSATKSAHHWPFESPSDNLISLSYLFYAGLQCEFIRICNQKKLKEENEGKPALKIRTSQKPGFPSNQTHHYSRGAYLQSK